MRYLQMISPGLDFSGNSDCSSWGPNCWQTRSQERDLTEKDHVGSTIVEFCKGARQSGLVSAWQHTLVGQRLQGFL